MEERREREGSRSRHTQGILRGNGVDANVGLLSCSLLDLGETFSGLLRSI